MQETSRLMALNDNYLSSQKILGQRQLSYANHFKISIPLQQHWLFCNWGAIKHNSNIKEAFTSGTQVRI